MKCTHTRLPAAAGKIIDFAVHDASGALAHLEVKAWTARRWVEELAAARSNSPKRALSHMIEQLKAAKSTGQPVYLAVSDAIGNSMAILKEFLSRRELDDVNIINFAESRLQEVAGTLRKGLGLTAGIAIVTVDQITKEESDD